MSRLAGCNCMLATFLQSFHIDSRNPRGCRRNDERNRSPQSFDQDVDFETEGSSQLGRRMSMTNYVGNDVKDLIRQTLKVIRSLVNNEQDPPASLLKLNMIAEREKGWLLVVESLIETVPDDDSLGPAVITLFLDECPLPSKDTVHRLLCSLRLDLASSSSTTRKRSWHRNTCIVLGSLAEKLAGSSSVAMCNPTTLNYLISRILPPFTQARVVLFALLALEKFAQTSENQFLISRTLEESATHPLKQLEEWRHCTSNAMKRQVGFCATWALDNIFITPNRIYAYETTNVSNINAMLNHEDVSEYLKIGPDGLEARCDVSSFESVRCTFAVQDGVWFYEATVFTPGVMQIGFATKRSRFLNHEGYGIGDDESSVAYDGCRQLLWHNANSSRHEHEPWSPGDVVGCLLNIPLGTVMFYLNGRPLQRPHLEFLRNRPAGDGVFAAASFMSFQQCRFNFGAEPFKYPPDIAFSTFNDGGATLTTEQKTILPRRRRLELLQKEPIPEDYCTICYANPGDTLLEPCMHGMPRTFEEECAFIERVSECKFKIKKGFVPNMNVECRFYVNKKLEQQMFEELRLSIGRLGNVAALPGIVGHSIGLPDIHSGYGFSIGNIAAFDCSNKDSVISPGGVGFDINCGVRLIRTNLFERDVQPVKEQLAQALFDYIPVGVGSRGAIPMSASDLVDCLEMGMDWTLREGYSWAEDKEHCEEYGRMLQADATKVSTRAKKRGLPQLGTLGAGNHYAEVQVVDEIFDKHAASKMGIGELGQVVVMLHCGSRGLGHQVATDALVEMEKAMARDGIVVNDRQLACARLNSTEGQDYLKGMAAAANFAWVNRSCMTFCVRQAFANVFTMQPDDLDMQMIYDVSHNVAKMEEHLVDGRPTQLCVHRKGATRAFPPHHPLIPIDYQLTGQPVLIGGSMGTCSYVLTGTERGMVEAYGTTCHGAGRALSRSKSRQKIPWTDVIENLKQKGISIRLASPKLIMEEAPESYKDVTDVVNTCDMAGISKKAVKLRPIAVIKG
ncbi:unnamed protein product [Nippostrongylus brasiliensis]|uniref:RNA-splicing ligase RtcB homolog n=1 Tax=Nippostrongylus brasiliensis TaxID=27835 RepID=A0A158QZI0_NIPBR|nr:unnamed protein product [Nippostrongylus brasiliensis]